MSPTASLLAFTAAAGLMTVTPGLDTALVLRTATVEGGRSALAAGLGIVLGCLVWGTLAALGVDAVLDASALAYRLLRWAGAAYLLWLALHLLLRPGRATGADEGSRPPAAPFAGFRRGLLTNLLNPKVGIFYMSFLPQFVPAGADALSFTLLLAAIHASLGMLWFVLLVLATRRIAAALRRPAVVRALDRATGAVFLLFGLRLVFGDE